MGVFRKLLSALQSKKGIAGAVLLLAYALYGTVQVLGNIDAAVKYAVPTLNFLGTGLGVLVIVSAGVLLILWAVYSQQEVVPVAGTREDAKESGVAAIVEPQNAEEEAVEKLRAEAESLRAQRDELQGKLGQWEGDRVRFKDLLTNAYTEGLSLRESKPSAEEARSWERHIKNLLEQAVGDEPARRVLKDDPTFRSAHLDATEEQRWMESRLNRLHDLMQQVKTRHAIPFRSGFDPHEWKDWKSPPQGASQDPKQCCLELADELHGFLEEHALDEAARAEMVDADLEIEIARADTDTMREFRKGPKKKVMSLLANLKERGWWKQEDFDPPDWEAVESLAHPHDIQLVADRLERLGYDL